MTIIQFDSLQYWQQAYVKAEERANRYLAELLAHKRELDTLRERAAYLEGFMATAKQIAADPGIQQARRTFSLYEAFGKLEKLF